MHKLTPLIFSSFFAVHAAFAQSSPPEALQACAAEADDARRLSCYDREAARIRQPSVHDEQAAQAPAEAENFGYSGAVAREELDRRRATQKDERLSATIHTLSFTPHGAFVVTLDNGQVWMQKGPASRVNLKVGDEITIKTGALGSYTLVTASRRTAKVTRTK